MLLMLYMEPISFTKEILIYRWGCEVIIFLLQIKKTTVAVVLFWSIQFRGELTNFAVIVCKFNKSQLSVRFLLPRFLDRRTISFAYVANFCAGNFKPF